MYRRLICILTALVVISLQLACGFSGPQATPTPTKTPKPPETATPKPTPTPTPLPTDTPTPPPTDTPVPPPPTDTPPPPPPTDTPKPKQQAAPAKPTNTPAPPPTNTPLPAATAAPATSTPLPSQGPSVTLSIDPKETTPGEEVTIEATAYDSIGVSTIEWGAALSGAIIDSDSKSCGDKTTCTLKTTMEVPLEGVFEIYIRATDSDSHVTIVKDNLYVASN